MAKKIKYSFLLFILITVSVNSQIKVRSLPNFNVDSLLVNDSSPRKIIRLSEGWKVYTDTEKKDFKKVTIPFIINEEKSFNIENEFLLSQEEINNSTIKLFWGGIYSSIDIYLNGSNIFKRSIGEIPYEIELPNDLLLTDKPNKIIINVNSRLDSKNTIPLKQSFLFPENKVGILRSIFIRVLPKTNIASFDLNYSLDTKLSTATANLKFSINNFGTQKESSEKDVITVNLKLIPKNFTGTTYSFDFPIAQSNPKELQKDFKLEIPNPVLWSNESPNIYSAELSLLMNKQIVDSKRKDISFFRMISDNRTLTFNNNPFVLKGITYIVNEDDLIRSGYLDKLKKDLLFIKNSGFNSVRFAKAYPDPLAIKLCNELGLFSLVELPLNSVPEEFLIDAEFRLRALNRFNEMIESYSQYSSSIFWGAGSSYLSNSTATEDFINYLLTNRNHNNFITYSSFVGFQKNSIDGLGLLGTEIYSTNPEILSDSIEKILSDDNNNIYFLSEINYPNYNGPSGGYLIKNSTEARAKYFGQIIDVAEKNKLNGFFINTLYNYSGEFGSLYGGNKTDFQLGIFNSNPTSNNLEYKVLEAKLNDKGKVTIPIGSDKDENKLTFILIALGLSILMAVLINTSRKFRDDCSRAFFRPYNFYSDIRDQRIISGFHTFILLVVEAGSISLLFTILFYYLRTNILVEKILLSFGEPKILHGFSFLAWNPEKGFIIIFILIILKIILLSLLIKGTSFFIKTRILLSSIFFMIIWSLLPFTVLLPVELILYKILANGSFNTLIIVFISLFWLWILQRIFKGIHVLFETNKLKVYFYGLIIIVFVLVGISVYFQMTNSTLYYLSNTIKQYRLISL
ncbi:MAG: hypothetical protein GYA14_05590 [Ignavibacteria bacterium]|nr:hypothetical protein [Ignavibacteria bacterium]